MQLTNSLLRKSPTSSVVDGPPMFMKTMAVGPFEDVASWVTGGTTVAIDLLDEMAFCEGVSPVHVAAVLVMVEVEACLRNCDTGNLDAILWKQSSNVRRS